HWVQGEMLSIGAIAKLSSSSIPIVWTLHDMWAFCGAEHYAEDFRWRDGYNSDNRPKHERGIDLNRWVWIKKKKWKKMQIITPSRWLADCAKNSALMKDWPVIHLPNAIDLDFWSPIEKTKAKELLGVSLRKKVILFGAAGGTRDPRKGFDLLLEALKFAAERLSKDEVEILIFGSGDCGFIGEILGIRTRFLGKLSDELSLKVAYNAADVFVMPSRQDNLPNTVVESLSCGTPVVGFAIGGIPDLVEHKKNGFIATPFDTQEFGSGISWILEDRERHINLQIEARRVAVEKLDQTKVAKKILALYQSLMRW
ncbi:MAG: glycosyltransferase, partial [Bdellovibrionaceae bacterium]|nr:glycosyltransferase [Pseudobdellovibrionaceae bacterium]